MIPRPLMRHPLPQWLIRLVAGALMLVALVGSLSPGLGPSNAYGIDKMVHVLGYAVLAFSLGEVRGIRWPLALTLAITMGGLTEGLQTAVPERSGSWADFFAGGLGAILGLAGRAALSHARTQARNVAETKGVLPAGGAPDPVPHDSGMQP
ncbi:MAG: hypothetical protein K9H25_01445 [Rhodospirillum sp.]|nr:hypothetical protein [Rhodospirillum sp.]MCF8488110.1 hypothetical protein [Rhodospirillum sp.]MCF8501283.1 hypothetical protein [Rhodospirillum sp.]